MTLHFSKLSQMLEQKGWVRKVQVLRQESAMLSFVVPSFAQSGGEWRVAPTCVRRGSSRRSPRPARRAKRPKKAREDSILDDGDIDTTDITTYVSCATCCNSLMLRPQQLEGGALRVACNCCGKRTEATLERLENVNGTPFDATAWSKGMHAFAGLPPPYSESDVAQELGQPGPPQSD